MGVYGPGTYVDDKFTPLPQECKRLLKYLASITPGFTQGSDLLDKVNFVGSDYPNVPGPIKQQAVASVIHAIAGIVGQEILELRGDKVPELTIDTDQAGLYLATPVAFTVDGKHVMELMHSGEYAKIVPDFDGGKLGTPLKLRASAIYPTKDPAVWYQWHGSLNPDAVLELLGLDPEAQLPSNDAAYELIKSRMIQYSAAELEVMTLDKGVCGSICYSPQQWLETQMGKSLARHPLFNYTKQIETPDLPPIPFKSTADKRPLAGIKVVELARIIAAPVLGQNLAALGAEVIRVQKKEMPDMSMLQCTLTAGKSTINLDLNIEGDKQKLYDLIADADVIIQGYRLGSLARKGFGKEQVLAMANARKRGVVYIDENCFGPDGYYCERPGWQQIADAAAGSSYVMGRGYGFKNGECVLPSLPISDMVTGMVGAVSALMALRDRAKYGGSYHGTAALTAYNAFALTKEVGLYQPEVVAKIQDIWSFPKMTPDLHVIDLFVIMIKAWLKKGGLADQDERFVHFNNSVYGKDLKILAPMIKYDDSKMTPHWTSPPQPFCHDAYHGFTT